MQHESHCELVSGHHIPPALEAARAKRVELEGRVSLVLAENDTQKYMDLLEEMGAADTEVQRVLFELEQGGYCTCGATSH